MIDHPIPPVFNEDSKILILGSFPSVASREAKFFYGHKQNRFWRVLAAVFDSNIPESTEEKKAFLFGHGIALWDVIGSCDITGSSDSSIKNAIPNDISVILKAADIQKIYVNGKTALKYYNKYIRNNIRRDAICLPSTSPANATWTLEKLITAWKVIL